MKQTSQVSKWIRQAEKNQMTEKIQPFCFWVPKDIKLFGSQSDSILVVEPPIEGPSNQPQQPFLELSMGDPQVTMEFNTKLLGG